MVKVQLNKAYVHSMQLIVEHETGDLADVFCAAAN